MTYSMVLLLFLIALMPEGVVFGYHHKGRFKDSLHKIYKESKGESAMDYNVGLADPPTFTTEGKTLKIITGDTVVLPCDVVNPSGYLLAWKRGIAILSAGNVKVTPDERFRLVDGYNLEIRDVQTQDAGDYVCQIATLNPLEITHTLEILVPPRIHSVTSGGNVEVKKGLTVTLECRASGNPVPVISWTRKNNLLPSGEKSVEGYSIIIEQATRHHAGVYLCTASNSVGEPVTAQISLHVLYPPEIEVERGWVHSGEGYEAQLVCIVHAEPQAEVLWYRDTLRLDTTERRIMEVRGSRHTLIIRKVQSSDFGNYSCVADNTMGKAREYLELSGKPNPAIFRSHPMGRFKDSYNLTWSVNSYTPIEEFRLYFRRLPPPPVPGQLTQPQHHHNKRPTRRENETWGGGGGGSGVRLRDEWNDVILPAAPSEQFTQQMSYMIRGLEPALHYEARVQAKNRFGWNDISDTFLFTTRGVDPEMRDMGVTAQSVSSTCKSAANILFVSFVMAVCLS
ncbi:limbic system-associated membrane protein [Nilaparvata lugens]|uniref:limbic system-associated membrane protein n=1 Tax=Nilaparvata lugens TaxID=108931 RepID=UPI00193E602C|nr:limbic system-associated membrane protein [Nilaparvata lugens]XP_039280252.1 limbic system-associated membrane protein [Nilaparvata lugens]